MNNYVIMMGIVTEKSSEMVNCTFIVIFETNFILLPLFPVTLSLSFVGNAVNTEKYVY